MKKLRLELDRLRVETFELAAPGAASGTVAGHDSATGPEEPDTIVSTCDCPPTAGQATCGNPTCAWTCTCPGTSVTCGEYTCNHTCPDSCYVCGPQDP
jgi:hypothetical protein